MTAVAHGPDAWYLPAPAKLNLQLRIVGRRADGYHLLETLFHSLALHDELWLRPRPEPGVALHVTAERPQWLVPAGPDNLVVRALQAFAHAHGLVSGFEVHLHKCIPAGGGLGGGSSDAAAALRLAAASLARVGEGGHDGGQSLVSLAATLGADVPFFLLAGSAVGRGVGEDLQPAIVTPRHFALVLPAFGCPTADVYKMYAALWNTPSQGDSVPWSTVSGMLDAAERMEFFNALQSAAEHVRPALADLRRRVAACGFPQVCMTGSGSTLFVAFATADEAERAAHALQDELRREQVLVLPTCSGAGAAAAPERRVMRGRAP